MAVLQLRDEYWRFREPEELANAILQERGPLLRLADIWQLLGYPSLQAARKAAIRESAPIELIELPGRRGRFARTTEFARWLFTATDWASASSPSSKPRTAL